MNRLRVAYFGGGPIGIEVLRFLARQREVEIVAVAAWPRSRPAWWGSPELADVARELQLPTVDSEDTLSNIPFDVLFSVYYDRLIQKGVLDLPKIAAINVHAAPLPDYRGRFTFLYAILNGESEYGATLHVMDEGFDTGPIIAKRMFTFGDRTTARELYDRTGEVAVQLFKDTLPSIVDGSFKATPQGVGTYLYKTADMPDGEVDLSWPPDYIDRFVRSMHFPPFEPAYLRIAGKKYFLTLADE